MSHRANPSGSFSTDLASRRVSEIPESSTVAIADLAARLRRAGKPVVDFSAGRAAEHSPDAIGEAAIAALRDGQTHQTEARGRPEYLAACAGKLNAVNGLDIDADNNVIATLGCKQGLVLALMSVIDIGDEVIIEDPSFVSYPATIRMLGGEPVPVPLDPDNRFCWREAELENAVTPRTRAILYCSPHNPAGTVHTAEDLRPIVSVARRHNLTVIADEIYEAVAWDERSHLPIYSLPGMCERTIGLMGMTKTYSMGGWRIGYAYAAPPLIEAMTRVQQHLMTCAGSFTQLGAARALSPDGIASMRETWADWEQRCRHATSCLNAMPGLTASMPEGGFYAWVDVSETGLSSGEFCEQLISGHQVAAVPGRSFGKSADHYVRMTCVRSWDELREGLERVEQFVESLR